MGRKLVADLVVYAVVGAGTRLQSVPHLPYEPGQSFSSTSSGFVGGNPWLIRDLRFVLWQVSYGAEQRRGRALYTRGWLFEKH